MDENMLAKIEGGISPDRKAFIASHGDDIKTEMEWVLDDGEAQYPEPEPEDSASEEHSMWLTAMWEFRDSLPLKDYYSAVPKWILELMQILPPDALVGDFYQMVCDIEQEV